jgi:two-component system, response regulator YesN
MDWRVLMSQQIVEREYGRAGLTLRALAKRFGISPYYLGKVFHRETGQSFHDLLLNVRMEKARQFLADPLLSIREIAYRVGYSDPSNFCRAFRLKFGITPRGYCHKTRLLSCEGEGRSRE